MAYKTENLLKRAKKVLEEDSNIEFWEDLYDAIGVNRDTAKKHGIRENGDIKTLLYGNRRSNKAAQRAKWAESDSASLQLALYKLRGTTEERQKLSTNYNKNEEDGEVNINITQKTK
jgi:hypothetical protein